LQLLPYVKLARPTQWLKNLMLFFPPFLGGSVLQAGVVQRGMLPFAAFCLASSSTYIVNDILDADTDLNHPEKRHRPLPSGRVTKSNATILAGVLLLGGIRLGLSVSQLFLAILLSYAAISIAYSFTLKHVPIVDLFCVSSGFIFRLQAGGESFKVAISDWLFLSVFLLAVFLSTGKRLCEKKALGELAGNHRRTLSRYPHGFLDGTMYLTGAAVLVTYTMYAISRHSLVYSVPLCTFGLLRYMFRVKSGFGGDPTESLLKDLPLFVTGILWAMLVAWSIYG
jgi:4-hydroxybenzoate polyprenyltransferase